MQFTNLTTIKNFKMKSIKMHYNICSDNALWLYIAALNALQTTGSEQSKSVCIIPGAEIYTQTSSV